MRGKQPTSLLYGFQSNLCRVIRRLCSKYKINIRDLLADVEVRTIRILGDNIEGGVLIGVDGYWGPGTMYTFTILIEFFLQNPTNSPHFKTTATQIRRGVTKEKIAIYNNRDTSINY